jgi:CyaY protein
MPMIEKKTDEKIYRQQVDDVFRRIDAAFEHADPDLAESINSQGTLTIVFRESLRLIVSPQAPLRQIWVAFKDRAWHFVREEATGAWMDDRGQGIELYKLIEDTTRTTVGVAVSISRA